MDLSRFRASPGRKNSSVPPRSQRDADVAGATALTVAEMLRDHDQKLDSLLEWRSELRGAMALTKLAMGASILSAAVSIIAILAFWAGQH